MKHWVLATAWSVSGVALALCGFPSAVVGNFMTAAIIYVCAGDVIAEIRKSRS